MGLSSYHIVYTYEYTCMQVFNQYKDMYAYMCAHLLAVAYCLLSIEYIETTNDNQ